MSHKPETAAHMLARFAKVRAQRDALLAACVEFVRKVDCGQAKSVASYHQMKTAIELCNKGGEL